jgi:glutamate--cysteine ligase
MDDEGWDEASANHAITAKQGRDPELVLQRNGQAVSLTDWAGDIVDGVRSVAGLIDQGSDGSTDYVQSVDVQAALLSNPDGTPSARVLNELRERGIGFFEFAMECARGHRDYFASLAPLAPDRLRLFDDEARESLQRQAGIEAADSDSFDDYLAKYYASA